MPLTVKAIHKATLQNNKSITVFSGGSVRRILYPVISISLHNVTSMFLAKMMLLWEIWEFCTQDSPISDDSSGFILIMSLIILWRFGMGL